jgi:hypothetical protein
VLLTLNSQLFTPICFFGLIYFIICAKCVTAPHLVLFMRICSRLLECQWWRIAFLATTPACLLMGRLATSSTWRWRFSSFFGVPHKQIVHNSLFLLDWKWKEQHIKKSGNMDAISVVKHSWSLQRQ